MQTPRHSFVAVLAVATAGVITSFGFAPIEQGLLTVLGVAGYLVVVASEPVQRASRRFVLVLGATWALGFMAPLIWWMRAVSDGAYIGLVIAQVALMAPLALGLRWASHRRRWPLWGSAVWVTFEAVRSTVPFSGFPWGRLAHVSVDSPFASFARYVGTPATSAVVFLAAGCIAYVAIRRTWRATLIGSLSFLALAVVGSVAPTGTFNFTGTVDVALVQGDVPGEFGTWQRGAIFLKHLEATERLADDVRTGARPAPDFVIWPENGMDVDPGTNPYAAAQLDRAVRDVGAPILVGGILDGPTPTTAYNAGLVWSENGPGDTYVKRNLVPYGEYVPFRQTIGQFVPRFDREIPRDMLPGDKPGDLDIAGVTVGDTICWDIAYDTAIRDAVAGGAQLLAVQTSNASFTGTSQPDQQWQISQLRAVETGRYIVVASTNGVSGVADADGRTLEKAPVREPAIISTTVELATGMTLGVRLGPWIEGLLVAVTVIGVALTWRGRRA